MAAATQQELEQELRHLETYHAFVNFTLLRNDVAYDGGLCAAFDPHRLSGLTAHLVAAALAPAAIATVQLHLLVNDDGDDGQGTTANLVAWLPDGGRITVAVSEEDAGEPLRLALEGESEADPLVVMGASGQRAPALLSRVVDRSGEVVGLVQVIAAAGDGDGAATVGAFFDAGTAQALAALQDQLATVLLLLRLRHRDELRAEGNGDGNATAISSLLEEPTTAALSSSPGRFSPAKAGLGLDVLARALAEERAEGRRLQERVALLEGKHRQAKQQLRCLHAEWEAQTRQLEGRAVEETTLWADVEAQLQRRGRAADAARRLLGSAVAGVWMALEEAAFLTDVQSVSERMAAALLRVLVAPASSRADAHVKGGADGSPSRNGGNGARYQRTGARILFVAGRAQRDADASDYDGQERQQGPLVLSTAAGLVGDAEGPPQPQAADTAVASSLFPSPQTSPGGCTQQRRRHQRMEVTPGSLTETALLDSANGALLVPDARKDGRYTAACDGGYGAVGAGGASTALALIPLRRRAFLPDGSCHGADPLGVVQLWGPAGAGGDEEGEEEGGQEQGMAALLCLGRDDAQTMLSTLGALLSLVLEWCLAGRRGSWLRGDLLHRAAQLLGAFPLPLPTRSPPLDGSGTTGGLTLQNLQAWMDRLLPSLWAAGPAARVRATIRVLDPGLWADEGMEGAQQVGSGHGSPVPSPPRHGAAQPLRPPGIASGSAAEEALSKGCPVLVIGPCLVAHQQRARRRQQQHHERESEDYQSSSQQLSREAQREREETATTAAAVVAMRVVEALLEQGGCAMRGPPAHSSSTRLLTLHLPLRSAEGHALGALQVEMRAAPDPQQLGSNGPLAGWVTPAGVQLDALQQAAAALLGPALGRALSRRQAAGRVRAQEAEEDRRLAELQRHVDEVAARQEALQRANDALAAENDRLAGALAPLRREHEVLLAKYRRQKMAQAAAGEAARMWKAEKHMLRRAVRESKSRLAHTNEELLELRGALGELRRRVEFEGGAEGN